MKTVNGMKLRDTFVSMNNLAINKKDISAFAWDEGKMEIHVLMRSGHEHFLTFDDSDALSEAIYKLGN